MKQFRVPCLFGLAGKQAFPIYVGEPNPENHPLKYQSDWLRRERGGSVPRSVMDSLKRLQQIAQRSHVSFEDLCAYAIGQSRRKRSEARAEEAAIAEDNAIPAPETATARLPLYVIHNPHWERYIRSQDNEQVKLPSLTLVAKHEADAVEELSKPARKPKPGQELEPMRRRVPRDNEELEKYPFRHLYDWLRTKPAMGYAETQSIVAAIVPHEMEEEQLLLSTLMLEETQSVLLPHSFAETLDFLFHYDELHYSLAVVLDTGGQYLSRSTYGNLLSFYHMPKKQLEEVKQSLSDVLREFAALEQLPKQLQEMAPEGFNLKQFHKSCRQWFAQNYKG
jgi:hypothetical protein